MKDPKNNFRLPVQRLSFVADMKIRWKLFVLSFIKSFSTFGRWKVLIPVLLLTVLLPLGNMGVASYVYNNEQIIRGDFLYGYKRNLEKKKLYKREIPSEKAEYYLALSERRIREAEVALQRNGRSIAGFPGMTASKVLVKNREFPVVVSDDITAGLVTESSHFLSLSVEEGGRIVENIEKRVFLQHLTSHSEKTEQSLKKLKHTTSKQTTREIAVLAQKINTIYHQNARNNLAYDSDDLRRLQPIWLNAEEGVVGDNQEIVEEWKNLSESKRQNVHKRRIALSDTDDSSLSQADSTTPSAAPSSTALLKTRENEDLSDGREIGEFSNKITGEPILSETLEPASESQGRTEDAEPMLIVEFAEAEVTDDISPGSFEWADEWEERFADQDNWQEFLEEDFDKEGETLCSQGEQWAINAQGECKIFPTPCDIPEDEGWELVETCEGEKKDSQDEGGFSHDGRGE